MKINYFCIMIVFFYYNHRNLLLDELDIPLYN